MGREVDRAIGVKKIFVPFLGYIDYLDFKIIYVTQFL